MGSLCVISWHGYEVHCYAGMMPFWHLYGEFVSFGTMAHAAGDFGWKLIASTNPG